KLSTASVTEVPLMIQTGGNSVEMIQIELKYNPQALQVLEIRAADFFKQSTIVLNENERRQGEINFALKSNKDEVKGNGTVAYLTLLPVISASGSGSTSINFLQKTAVRGESGQGSLLQSTEDLVIEL